MVSEKDLQSYLKVAASALPCREARKEFSSYVHNVAHDISIENPDADFATVASLLGTTPKQVAADFVESPIAANNITVESLCTSLQIWLAIISRNNCSGSFFCSNLFHDNERSDDRQHRDYLYRFRWRRLLTERTR